MQLAGWWHGPTCDVHNLGDSQPKLPDGEVPAAAQLHVLLAQVEWMTTPVRPDVHLAQVRSCWLSATFGPSMLSLWHGQLPRQRLSRLENHHTTFAAAYSL